MLRGYLRPVTVYSYNQSVLVAVRILGDRPVDSYGADDIETFRRILVEEGRSEHTAARFLRELSAIFQFAKDGRHYIAENVVENLKFHPAAPVIEPFHEDELKAFFDRAWTRKKAVYYQAMFLLLTGCRSNESCTLQFEQIDPEADELQCRNEHRGRLESVPITPVLRAFLKDLPRDDDPFVFHYRSVHGLYRAVKNIIRACGAREQLAVHSFRETLGTTSREAGVDKNIIKFLTRPPQSQESLRRFPRREAQRRARRLQTLSAVHFHLIRGLQMQNGFGNEIGMP